MNKRNDRAEYREVYSTERGAVCSGCGCPKTACECAKRKSEVVKGDGNVRVRRETKGRGGKTVTTITGLAMHEGGLKDLLASIKRAVGGGGTLKDGVIEVQGDHCDLVLRELEGRGIKAKRAGG